MNSLRFFCGNPSWDFLLCCYWDVPVFIDTDGDLPCFRAIFILDIDAVFSCVFIADLLYGDGDHGALHIHLVSVLEHDDLVVFEPADLWVGVSRHTTS